jgi:hypothetical protein
MDIDLNNLTRVELVGLRHNLVLYSYNKEQVAAIDELIEFKSKLEAFNKWYDRKKRQQAL